MEQTKPKIYEYSVCPFCHKVKALLEYKKIPYESVEVNPMNKKEIAFSKGYRKVPILTDKFGIQVNDSSKIMRHLDEQYPENPVFNRDDATGEIEASWLKWSDETLVRALPPLVYDTFGNSLKAFNYITTEGNFSWFQRKYIKVSGAFVMWMVAKRTAKKQNISNPSTHFNTVLDDWTNALDGKSFHGGAKPNSADLSVFGILRSVEGLPAFDFVKKKPALYGWYQRTEQVLK